MELNLTYYVDILGYNCVYLKHDSWNDEGAKEDGGYFGTKTYLISNRATASALSDPK
jgi:hypothetical protein